MMFWTVTAFILAQMQTNIFCNLLLKNYLIPMWLLVQFGTKRPPTNLQL